jgi:hypothetical protein
MCLALTKFVGKAKSLPKWSTFLVLHSIIRLGQKGLLTKDKCFNLPRKLVNYGRKKFLWYGPLGLNVKVFFKAVIYECL